jgi:hypothetical protein
MQVVFDGQTRSPQFDDPLRKHALAAHDNAIKSSR